MKLYENVYFIKETSERFCTQKLVKPPKEGIPPTDPGHTCRQLELFLQPNPTQPKSWQTGDARFYFQSHQSTQPFGVFQGLLKNSHKYGLGSLRKTPTERHSPYRPRSHKRTIGLNPTTTKLRKLQNSSEQLCKVMVK